MIEIVIHAVLLAARQKNQRRRAALERWIPNLSALLADPRKYFAGGSTVIGERLYITQRPLLRLAAAFLLGGVAVAAGSYLLFEFVPLLQDLRPIIALIAMIVICFWGIGGCLFFAWLNYYVNYCGRIRLSLDGADFEVRGRIVRCPWRLFDVANRDSVARWASLRMPVDPMVINMIELRKGDRATARGADVRIWGFGIGPDDTVIVRDVYSANMAEVAVLLRQCARQLR
jgi:hypothetical protein